MSELFPEAYLHALHRFSPLMPQPELEKPTRQARFLNALAALLVSKPTGKAYAAALRPASPSEPPTLFVAGNNKSVPKETHIPSPRACMPFPRSSPVHDLPLPQMELAQLSLTSL